jgi:hypothetical protein
VLEDLAEGLSVRREVPTPIPPPVAEVLAQSRSSRFPVSLDDRADAVERGVAACRDALKGLDIDAIVPRTPLTITSLRKPLRAWNHIG